MNLKDQSNLHQIQDTTKTIVENVQTIQLDNVISPLNDFQVKEKESKNISQRDQESGPRNGIIPNEGPVNDVYFEEDMQQRNFQDLISETMNFFQKFELIERKFIIKSDHPLDKAMLGSFYYNEEKLYAIPHKQSKEIIIYPDFITKSISNEPLKNGEYLSIFTTFMNIDFSQRQSDQNLKAEKLIYKNYEEYQNLKSLRLSNNTEKPMEYNLIYLTNHKILMSEIVLECKEFPLLKQPNIFQDAIHTNPRRLQNIIGMVLNVFEIAENENVEIIGKILPKIIFKTINQNDSISLLLFGSIRKAAQTYQNVGANINIYEKYIELCNKNNDLNASENKNYRSSNPTYSFIQEILCEIDCKLFQEIMENFVHFPFSEKEIKKFISKINAQVIYRGNEANLYKKIVLSLVMLSLVFNILGPISAWQCRKFFEFCVMDEATEIDIVKFLYRLIIPDITKELYLKSDSEDTLILKKYDFLYQIIQENNNLILNSFNDLIISTFYKIQTSSNMIKTDSENFDKSADQMPNNSQDNREEMKTEEIKMLIGNPSEKNYKYFRGNENLSSSEVGNNSNCFMISKNILIEKPKGYKIKGKEAVKEDNKFN